MYRKFNPFANEDESFSWWWFGIKVGVITALIVLWVLDQQKKKQQKQVTNGDSFDDEKSIPLPDEASISLEKVSPAEIQPTLPDDLRRIEGIGPKIQDALQTAGIITFEQLAASNPANLKQIIVDAGIRIGYPDTWPEQAAYAAKGEWISLAEFQSKLQGGRRVS